MNASSLRDQIEQSLRRRIISGDLAPGSPVVESQVAREFDASRGPVREALQLLRAEGYIESWPGASPRVATPSVADVLDIYEVRANLERLSCRLAATNSGAVEPGELARLVTEGLAAVRAEDWLLAGRLNNTFHATIASLSGNRHLRSLIVDYDQRLDWMNATSARGRGHDAWEEHAAILEAIAKGDADLADKLAYAHAEASRLAYIASVQRAT